jgi:hypothetical protein
MHDKRLLEAPPATFAAVIESTPRDLLTRRGEGGLYDTIATDLVGTPGSDHQRVSMRLLLAELTSPHQRPASNFKAPKGSSLKRGLTGLMAGKKKLARVEPEAAPPAEKSAESTSVEELQSAAPATAAPARALGASPTKAPAKDDEHREAPPTKGSGPAPTPAAAPVAAAPPVTQAAAAPAPAPAAKATPAPAALDPEPAAAEAGAGDSAPPDE